MIDIGWIIDLVHSIPDILLYIVEGYIFVSVYNFILFKDDSEHCGFVAIIVNELKDRVLCN